MSQQPADDQEPEVLAQARKDAFTSQTDLEDKWQHAKNAAPSGHAWRKQGPHLVCTSCPVPHAHWVGNDFDTTKIRKMTSRSGLSAVPTPSDKSDGDITPKASTEPDNVVDKEGA